MPLLPKAVAVALATVVLAPAAAHAQMQQPYPLSVSWQPTAPTTHDDVAFKATTSAPEVLWDFNGDGHPDDSGATQVHRFTTAGDYRVIVTATWPGVPPVVKQEVESIHVEGGAGDPTPTPTPQLTVVAVPTVIATPAPTPAPCTQSVTVANFRASSMCFDVTAIPGGKRYSSKSWPIAVNGVMVIPQGGKPVTIDVTTKAVIKSENAKVYFTTHGSKVNVITGPINWTASDGKLWGFAFSWGAHPTMGGMPIIALNGAPQLLNGGGLRLSLYFALPSQFGGGSSSLPTNVDLGVAAASANGALTFKVKAGGLPGLPLANLVATFQGVTQWSIDADVALPQPFPFTVKGGISVDNGVFASLYGSVSGGPKFGPVTLKKLSFAVELNPKVSKCVPKVGKETINVSQLLYQATGFHFNVPNQVIDHGNPIMALCGNVSLTAGPTLLGHPAVALDGGLGFTVFKDRPPVFRAYGSLSLVGIAMTNAEFEVHTNGYVALKANFNLGWNKLAHISGYASLEMQGLKFNGEGGVKACLDLIDTCLGANGLLSSKGIAVCLNIDTFLGDWHPGIADKWGHAPKLYFSGCDLGPYRENIHAAQAGGARSVTLGKGLPGAAIAVTGDGASPRVAFVGPHGERIETPVDNKPLGGKGYYLMKSPSENLTQIALAKPSAGSWRVEPLDGSVAITGVRSASGLAKPSIKASVSHGKLSYRVKTMPGQVVTFSERGASAGGTIGVAHGAQGTLRFTPAAGRAERREIIAGVEQDGALRARLVVGHYRAPATRKPGNVRDLHARRAGKNLVATWHAAGTVEVTATLPDGRRLVTRSRGHKATFKGATRGTISIRALSADGLAGATTSVKVH